jgi:hypothetical protein
VHTSSIINIDASCRSSPEAQDRFIFDLFNIGEGAGSHHAHEGTLSKEEIMTMLYNLPPETVIKSKWKSVPGRGDSPDVKKSFMSMAGDDAMSKRSLKSFKESHMEMDFYSKLTQYYNFI